MAREIAAYPGTPKIAFRSNKIIAPKPTFDPTLRSTPRAMIGNAWPIAKMAMKE